MIKFMRIFLLRCPCKEVDKISTFPHALVTFESILHIFYYGQMTPNDSWFMIFNDITLFKALESSMKLCNKKPLTSRVLKNGGCY